MVMGLFWVFITGVLWMLVGILVSRITRLELDFVAIAAVSATVITVASWILFPDFAVLRVGTVPRIGMLTLVMLASGFFSPLGMLSLQKGMRTGNHGVVWTIGQSAMVIPFLFGVLIMRESVSLLQAAGMVAVVLAFLFFGREKAAQQKTNTATSGLWFWLAVLAFLLLGVQQTLATIPSHWINWQDTAHLRRPLLASGLCLGYVLVAIFRRRFPGRKEILYGVIYASIQLPSFYTLFIGMDKLKPHDMVSLVYPIAVGTCITGFVLYSIFVLREKSSAAGISGLVLAISGLILISL